MKEKLKLVQGGDRVALQEILDDLQPVVNFISSAQLMNEEEPAQAEDYVSVIKYVSENLNEGYSDKATKTYLYTCLLGGLNRSILERTGQRSKILSNSYLASFLKDFARRK